MILTKEEKQHIKIWRLLRDISVKHNEGYYSLEINPTQINKQYYLPKHSHCEFDTPEETIKSLKGLLSRSSYEYTYDLNGLIKKLAEKKAEKKKALIEIKELEVAYKDAISKINKEV